nr:monofunctional glycosyltransferase [Candidatus Cloacimonadota bacterium]
MGKQRKRRSFIGKAARWLLFVHLWYWGIIAILCILYSFVNPPITPIMLERYLIRGYPISKRLYIPLERIPKYTSAMLITLEDGNFYQHHGFEWNMIKEAYIKNKAKGKIIHGGSTLSNQLTRTLFLTTDRNYLRKYLEAQATVILELIMSKERILELYLNYAEWGKGIYGIQSAAWHYYKCSAENLSKERTMKLLCILSNPIRYGPEDYASSSSARARMRLLRTYY